MLGIGAVSVELRQAYHLGSLSFRVWLQSILDVQLALFVVWAMLSKHELKKALIIVLDTVDVFYFRLKRCKVSDTRT